jgi:microcystin-dependent protein
MVKHSTVVTGTNNAAYQVSVNAWNAEHDTPVGVVWLWAGAIANIPVNWLLCDGSSLSRTTYAVLFNAIGTIYGYVDGSHFNLPDLRDKFVVGAKQDVSGVPETNLTGSLTAYGGAVTHHHADHSVTQPAISNHTLTQPVIHTHVITQPVVAAHTYTTFAARTSSSSTSAAISAVTAHSLTTNVAVADHTLDTNVGIDAHALSTIVAVSTHDTLSAPQPYYAMAYIIRSV